MNMKMNFLVVFVFTEYWGLSKSSVQLKTKENLSEIIIYALVVRLCCH